MCWPGFSIVSVDRGSTAAICSFLLAAYASIVSVDRGSTAAMYIMYLLTGVQQQLFLLFLLAVYASSVSVGRVQQQPCIMLSGFSIVSVGQVQQQKRYHTAFSLMEFYRECSWKLTTSD